MYELNTYYVETYLGYDIFYDYDTDTYFVPELSINEDFDYVDDAEDFIRWY